MTPLLILGLVLWLLFFLNFVKFALFMLHLCCRLVEFSLFSFRIIRKWSLPLILYSLIQIISASIKSSYAQNLKLSLYICHASSMYIIFLGVVFALQLYKSIHISFLSPIFMVFLFILHSVFCVFYIHILLFLCCAEEIMIL